MQSEFEQQLDAGEKLRLLYVACTRARDYLFVSGHHRADAKASTLASSVWNAAADYFGATWRLLPPDGGQELPFAPPGRTARAGDDEAARAEWQRARAELVARAARPAVRPASGFAPEGAPVALPASVPPLPREVYDGTALGRAVHAALQRIEPAEPGGVDDVVHQCARSEGIRDVSLVARRVAHALESDVLQRASRASRAWRELYVAAPLDDVAVEGFIDLAFEESGGLVVVDYKTDAGAADRAGELVEHYAPQLGAYALALEHNTDLPVNEAVLLFITESGVIERVLRGNELARAKARVREAAAAG